MKAKISFMNICYYLQGNIRYFFYYSRFSRILIRKHIYQQIGMRINSMDSLCYSQGYCKLCGCTTTHLQMCNKACDKPCYPRMLNKRLWKQFIEKGSIEIDGMLWVMSNNKFVKREHIKKR